MQRFAQLHLLTSYPPANLNRDDTGRPKTAWFGEVGRLRISSQSLKRAWRKSDIFESAMSDYIGTRTKLMGKDAYERLLEAGVAETTAREWAKAIAKQFGKLKSEKKTQNNADLEIEQLAHFSPEEQEAVAALISTLAQRKSAPTDGELKLLRHPARAVDIAMFGRMLADAADYNVDAAVQVAHAITVHAAGVEDDYFSAVDDLNQRESTGAGHIGERGYGAGLFYLYVAIDRALLQRNLGDAADLAARALNALAHTATKVSPTGMQNSFASRSYASYVLAEKGDQQPRSLAQAFLKPIRASADESLIDEAVEALTDRCEKFDRVYNACADERYTLNVEAGKGSIDALAAFLAQ